MSRVHVLGRTLCFRQFPTATGALLWLDDYAHSGSLKDIMIIILIILVLVRIHPEPADDCPCFDDSVAFAGVIIGGEIAVWRYTHSPFSISDPVPGSTPYSLAQVGWIKSMIRVLLGVFIIFTWRATL